MTGRIVVLDESRLGVRVRGNKRRFGDLVGVLGDERLHVPLRRGAPDRPDTVDGVDEVVLRRDLLQGVHSTGIQDDQRVPLLLVWVRPESVLRGCRQENLAVRVVEVLSRLTTVT